MRTVSKEIVDDNGWSGFGRWAAASSYNVSERNYRMRFYVLFVVVGKYFSGENRKKLVPCDFGSREIWFYVKDGQSFFFQLAMVKLV